MERQVAASLVFRAAYVGSHGNHLNLNIDENVAVPGPGPVPPRRPYPSYGVLSSWEPRGPSNYHGLQLSAEKRYSAGVSFLAAYTWSKSLNESEADGTEVGITYYNRRLEKARSSTDIRHRFVSVMSYELPVGKGRRFLNHGGIHTGARDGRANPHHYQDGERE